MNSNIFKSVFLALFIFAVVGVKGQTLKLSTAAALDLKPILNCNILVSAKNKTEQDTMQYYYWAMIGILADLHQYRSQYLLDGKLLNIFPTAYYHTTLAEVKRINDGAFKFPIDKMKQMLAFYKAFKYNREQWDKGAKIRVELHWEKYYNQATTAIPTEGVCDGVSRVMKAGIKAHVEGDLARAIAYAYNNRYINVDTKTAYVNKVGGEFASTDGLFKESTASTVKDIVQTSKCSELSLQVGSILLNFISATGSEKNVIDLRHKAWENGLSNTRFYDADDNLLRPQPEINITNLISIGRAACPPVIMPQEPVVEFPKEKPVVIPSDPTYLTGGETPDALGRLLLTAIKTNNIKLWNSCILPASGHLDKAAASDMILSVKNSFAKIREKLEMNGVSNFALLKFARVTFDTSTFIGQDGGNVNGEKVRRSFEIEFDYGTDFFGKIGSMTIVTFKKGKYFVFSAPTSANLRRNR